MVPGEKQTGSMCVEGELKPQESADVLVGQDLSNVGYGRNIKERLSEIQMYIHICAVCPARGSDRFGQQKQWVLANSQKCRYCTEAGGGSLLGGPPSILNNKN